jgi:hypothetical protein
MLIRLSVGHCPIKSLFCQELKKERILIFGKIRIQSAAQYAEKNIKY